MDIKITISNNQLDSLLSNNKLLNYLLLLIDDVKESEYLLNVEKICNEIKKEYKDVDLFEEFKRCYLAIPIGLRKSYLSTIIHKNVSKSLDDDSYRSLQRIIRGLGMDTSQYDLFNFISDRIAERICDVFGNKFSEIPDFVSELVDNDNDDEIRKLIDMLSDDNNIKKFIIDNNIDDNNDKIRVFKTIVLYLRSNYIKSKNPQM